MKNIIIVVIVGVVVIGGYFLLRSSYSPQVRPSSVNAPVVPISKPQTPESQMQQSQTSQPSSQKTESENVVVYSDSGYSPNTITIKAGATITFKNQSSQAMWTASAIHPSHRVYPTTGGCLGSTFDACKGIQPGESWPFKFDIPGTWKYHNHLNPGDTGTIVVQ